MQGVDCQAKDIREHVLVCSPPWLHSVFRRSHLSRHDLSVVTSHDGGVCHGLLTRVLWR